MRDPYKTLGVRPDAGADEIKAAWRTMAKAIHPDHNKNDPSATARFAEVGRAYETLKDPKKRSQYDKIASMAEVRSSGPTIMQQRQAAREAEERAKQARANAERVMEELARAKAKKAAEAAAAAAAQAKPAAASASSQPNAERAQKQATNGAAPEQPATESPEDMVERIFGAKPAEPLEEKSFASAASTGKPAEEAAAETQVGDHQEDEAADVDGVVAGSAFDTLISLPPFGIIKSLVRRIRGSSTAPQEKAPEIAAVATVTLDDIIKGNTITVPLGDGREVRFQAASGMAEGHVVHLKGQGLKLQGMLRGDVAVTVQLAPDERFTIRGFDLHTTLPVTIENAVLGCETSVESPYGRISVTVPPWSGSDRTIRIEGKGLPDGNGGKGDLIAELRLMLWEKPDDKVTDLMRSMKNGLVL